MKELERLVFEKKRAEKSEKRLWRALQTLACTFVVRADGWKLLCAELHVDPDSLIRELPGHDSICEMEEQARQIACSPEEAAAYLRERAAERDEPANGEAPTVRREYPIVTAEDVARSMRKCLEMKLASWS
jgi:hypothetical protein